tara:strand:+ start:134 stop:301 length:168 start_codon:yes stop_codon:yes gene_type:complete
VVSITFAKLDAKVAIYTMMLLFFPMGMGLLFQHHLVLAMLGTASKVKLGKFIGNI